MRFQTPPNPHSGGRLFLLVFLLASLAAALPVGAQITPPLSFEVATVKRVDQKNPHSPSVNISGDRFQAMGMTVKELIKVAYDLNYGADRQVSGGPAWAASDRFDIDARVDATLAQKLPKLSSEERGQQLRQMLRTLLADRFKLKVHHGTSELAVYDLIKAKSGPKLAPSIAQPSVGNDDGSAKPRSWIRFAGKGVLEGNDTDMDTLVTALTMQPEIGGRLVVDKTGLTGKYDFTLKWTPDMGPGTEAPAADAGPTLFTALKEELGLQLESTKAPVDVIVIDRVVWPTAD